MKKIFAFVLALVMVACMFTTCGSTAVYDSQNDITVEVDYADLAPIPGRDYLYYSVSTHTVYYLYAGLSQYTSFMCPYISNGHYCEYVGSEIVEVIPTVRIEDTTD